MFHKPSRFTESVVRPLPSYRVDAALLEERQFVLALGGNSLEIAGANLVFNERIPVPRFNFIQELRVGRNRQTAFFEKALDHYFQRALRPSIRVPVPTPAHVNKVLLDFSFRPLPHPLSLLLTSGKSRSNGSGDIHVTEATPSELETLAAFWTAEGERAEFRRALDVVWHHPNPEEEMTPVLAKIDNVPVSVALLYRYRSTLGIHGVATVPQARGLGAASAIVLWALQRQSKDRTTTLAIFSDSPRLERRLRAFGFVPQRSYTVFELPLDAQLALPPPGPPSPPRWRPQRASKS